MQAMLSLIITDGEFQEEAHANIIHKTNMSKTH
jgi:hypothetical protein